MRRFIHYIKNNPMWPLMMVFVIGIFGYIVYEQVIYGGLWPLIWLGIVVVAVITIRTYQNIRDRWDQ